MLNEPYTSMDTATRRLSLLNIGNNITSAIQTLSAKKRGKEVEDQDDDHEEEHVEEQVDNGEEQVDNGEEQAGNGEEQEDGWEQYLFGNEQQQGRLLVYMTSV